MNVVQLFVTHHVVISQLRINKVLLSYLILSVALGLPCHQFDWVWVWVWVTVWVAWGYGWGAVVWMNGCVGVCVCVHTCVYGCICMRVCVCSVPLCVCGVCNVCVKMKRMRLTSQWRSASLGTGCVCVCTSVYIYI